MRAFFQPGPSLGRADRVLHRRIGVRISVRFARHAAVYQTDPPRLAVLLYFCSMRSRNPRNVVLCPAAPRVSGSRNDHLPAVAAMIA
jgi:hypothetical protein